MLPVILTKALTAASANNIALSQTPGAAGNLTINGAAASGGVATLDSQRRVLITSGGGNESGRTFTIFGTSDSGQGISEAVTGPGVGLTVASLLNYRTVTRISVDAATAGAITVGTNTTGSTDWKNSDIHLTPFNLQIETTVSGSATYSLEYTMDDFAQGFSWYHGPADTIRVRTTTMAGATANGAFTFTFPVRGWRITVTAGTGTVTAEGLQAGIVQ